MPTTRHVGDTSSSTVCWQLHVEWYQPPGKARQGGRGDQGSPEWKDAVAAKVRFVRDFLASHPENVTALFTDLDVVPLRPLGVLRQYVRSGVSLFGPALSVGPPCARSFCAPKPPPPLRRRWSSC